MLYVLNLIFTIYILFIPGFSLSQFFFHKTLKRWILPFRIVIYFIVSLSVVFFISFLLSELCLPFFVRKCLAIFVLLGFTSLALFQIIKYWKKQKNWRFNQIPWILYSGIILFIIAWSICIYYQPYPGILSVGMGDEPEYYALAKNIYLGYGFTVNYFIGDFWTGPKIDISDVINGQVGSNRRPLAPYIVSYLFYITGQNHYAIGLLSMMLAILTPVILYSFIFHYKLMEGSCVSNQHNKIYQLIAIISCLFPNYFIFCSLGSSTLLEGVPFLVTVMLLKLKEWKNLDSLCLISLSVGLTTISRPEGVVLTFIAFLIYIMPVIITSIKQRMVRKNSVVIMAFIIGILAFNLPVLFIKYGPVTGGIWIQAVKYNSDSKWFEFSYHPWPEFNRAITKVNFSINKDIKSVFNPKVLNSIASHPFIFCKWFLSHVNTQYVSFFSIYVSEYYDIYNLKLKGLDLYAFTDYIEKNHSILDSILTFYFDNSYIIKSVVLCVLMTLFILVGPAREMLLLLYLFIFGFFFLNYVLYARQAFVLMPLITFAFIVGISSKSLTRYKKILFTIRNNKLSLNKLSINLKSQKLSQIDILLCQILRCIWENSKINKILPKIFITFFFLVLIFYECNTVLNNIVKDKINQKYIPYISIINNYTEPYSTLICDYPQLYNFMTDRICIGGTFLLDILNPNLEIYSPDYILVESNLFSTYNRILKLRHNIAYNYVTKNYYPIFQDEKEDIMLFKHK